MKINLQKLLSDLIKLKTVTGNREEIKKLYDYIENLFSKDIFDISYYEHKGVLSQVISFKGVNWKKAKILLNGHVDVVPADDKEFVPRVEKEKIYGRGTADMKGGVVAMILALLRMADMGQKSDCALLLTSDEEIGGENGVGYLVKKEKLQPKFVLIADGPCQDELKITLKEKGILWLEIKTTGKASHAARPWLGQNALHILFEAIDNVRELVGKKEKDAWVSSAVTSRVETNNSTVNAVPSDARALIDIRFTEELAKTPDELLKKIQKIMPKNAEAKKIASGSILFTDKNHPYILKLQKVMKNISGGKIPFGFGHGGSDGRYFSGKKIPTVLIGSLGGNWHAANEWVDLNSVDFLEKSLFNFIKEISKDISL